jgi:outer membrane autotransporter protein
MSANVLISAAIRPLSGSGQSGFLGLVLKRQMGPWLLAGGLAASYGSSDTSRTMAIGGISQTLTVSPTGESVGLRLNAAYDSLISDDWYVRPKVSLDVIYAQSNAYSESSASGLALSFAAAHQTVVAGTPAVEIGKRLDLGGGTTLRAFATAGISLMSQNSWDVQSQFLGAPPGVGSFTTSIPTPNVVGPVDLGAQILSAQGVDARLQYDGEFAGNVVSNAGLLTLGLHF